MDFVHENREGQSNQILNNFLELSSPLLQNKLIFSLSISYMQIHKLKKEGKKIRDSKRNPYPSFKGRIILYETLIPSTLAKPREVPSKTDLPDLLSSCDPGSK